MYCVLCTCTIFCIYLLDMSTHLGGGRENPSTRILWRVFSDMRRGRIVQSMLLSRTSTKPLKRDWHADGPEVEATRGTTQNRPAMYDVQHLTTKSPLIPRNTLNDPVNQSMALHHFLHPPDTITTTPSSSHTVALSIARNPSFHEQQRSGMTYHQL